MHRQVQSGYVTTDVRMPVEKLVLGMFVSELDRPWSDTPFLLHGLLLETEAELDTICRLCREVSVDRSRSVGLEEVTPARETADDPPPLVTIPALWQVTTPATGGPVELQAATGKPQVEAAGQAPIRSSLWAPRVLGWRALLELIGLGRAAPRATVVATPDPKADDSPREEDLTAEELAEAALHVKRFEAELPRAARTIRQSLPVLLAAYRNAEDDRPLEIETLDPVVAEIVDSVLRNDDAMLWLTRLQSHDHTAHARSLLTAVYMAHFGSHLGLPRADLEHLALGGALLDIGKTRVPKEILHKPGPLDEDELRQARSHVEVAMRLLDASGVIDSRVREIVGRHHERENGSGYPGQMLGDSIGLYGRIAGIVDTFLAMTQARSYAPAIPMEQCLRVLLWARGILFHAPLVEHFIQMTGLYPVGSLVELSTGEVAAVLCHNRVRRLKPRVLVMTGADGEPLPRPRALDLLHGPQDAAGEEIRIVRGLPPGSRGIKLTDIFAATVPE